MKQHTAIAMSAVLALTLALGACQNPQASLTGAVAATKLAPQTPINEIPYPKGYDTKSSGASSYAKSGDHADSPYFAHPDYYNLKSTKTLTILPKFKTYQQTTEWSCGNATALMVLHHFGEKTYKELDIAKVMQSNADLNGSNKETPGLADEEGEYGTSTAGMVKFFQSIGYDVQSSLTKDGKSAYTFEDPAKFTEWVIGKLKAGVPIMVEWIDWAGHWQAIIGYDTMGTEGFGDDVLVLADPYDTSDHLQDGYYTVPAERFFYMWFDAHILPQDQKLQNWVIATPKNYKAK